MVSPIWEDTLPEGNNDIPCEVGLWSSTVVITDLPLFPSFFYFLFLYRTTNRLLATDN